MAIYSDLKISHLEVGIHYPGDFGNKERTIKDAEMHIRTFEKYILKKLENLSIIMAPLKEQKI